MDFGQFANNSVAVVVVMVSFGAGVCVGSRRPTNAAEIAIILSADSNAICNAASGSDVFLVPGLGRCCVLCWYILVDHGALAERGAGKTGTAEIH